MTYQVTGATDSLEKMILTQLRVSIERWIKEASDELVKQYTAEFEQRIRKVVAQTALMVFQEVSIERAGPNLIIRVRIEDKNGST